MSSRGMSSAALLRGSGSWSNRFSLEAQFAVARPDDALRELDREDCKTLRGFTRVFWPVLEPGRRLVEGYALDAIDDHLTAVSRGQIKKLLMNVPPGCMKSLKTAAFWPAFEWGPLGMAWLRYVCASYDATLSVRDNRRCRMIIDSPRYRELYGVPVGMSAEAQKEFLAKPENAGRFAVVSDQDAKVKFENTARGWKIATSVGGAVVGERGDRFIIDDPHNIKTAESTAIREETLRWFAEVVPSRVNDPENAVFVVIMQRVHERDVSGLILAKELGYEHLCLPMEWEHNHPHRSRTSIGFVDWREAKRDKIANDNVAAGMPEADAIEAANSAVDGELLWPERFSEAAVQELKTQLRSWGGTYAEAGQLQQRPSPRGGGMFPVEWWRFYGTSVVSRPLDWNQEPPTPLPTQFDQVLLSVDASFKATTAGSRVSILVLGARGPFRYILDNVTRAMTFRETCDAIAVFDSKDRVIGGLLSLWHANVVLIEDKANGPAIVNTLREKISGILALNPEGGKEARGSAITAAIESGHVLLPDGATWLPDFISEFASFPAGARDDQVDALSQAMIYLVNDPNVARAVAMSRM